MLKVFELVWLLLPPIVALIVVRRHKARGNEVANDFVLERFLFWYLVLAVGVAGVLNGLSQMFNPEATADLNDWTDSQFIIELGFMNFAFGVLGRACIKVRGTWWYAAGIGYSIFLLLAAYYHVYDWAANGNTSAGNLGPSLWADIGIAIVIPILCARHARATSLTDSVGRRPPT